MKHFCLTHHPVKFDEPAMYHFMHQTLVYLSQEMVTVYHQSGTSAADFVASLTTDELELLLVFQPEAELMLAAQAQWNQLEAALILDSE
ncbi:MAG: hypothetical protein HC875_10310 [Anaerolineales bacterium]|nr:hypothetical protein [Anaerolineales bacterium]